MSKPTKKSTIEAMSQEESYEEQVVREEAPVQRKTLTKKRTSEDTIKILHQIFKTDNETILETFRATRRLHYIGGRPEGLILFGYSPYFKKGPQGLLEYMKKSWDLGNPVVAIAYSKPSAVAVDLYSEGKWLEIEYSRIFAQKTDFWYYVLDVKH
jgi:hypothetical protein